MEAQSSLGDVSSIHEKFIKISASLHSSELAAAPEKKQ